MGELIKKKKKTSLIERLKQKQQDIKSRGGSSRFHITKEGKTRYRILPVGDQNDWSLEVIHFFPNRDIGGFISPAQWDLPCAFMEYYNKIKESKLSSNQELAKNMRPRKKYVAAAIAYNDELGKEINHQSGARLLLMPASVVNGLIDLFTDPENGDFTDPVEGYDVKVIRTGKGLTDTEYSVVAGKTSKLNSKYNKIYDLEEMAKECTPSYEETKLMLEKFLGSAPESNGKVGLKKKKKIKRDL